MVDAKEEGVGSLWSAAGSVGVVVSCISCAVWQDLELARASRSRRLSVFLLDSVRPWRRASLPSNPARYWGESCRGTYLSAGRKGTWFSNEVLKWKTEEVQQAFLCFSFSFLFALEVAPSCKEEKISIAVHEKFIWWLAEILMEFIATSSIHRPLFCWFIWFSGLYWPTVELPTDCQWSKKCHKEAWEEHVACYCCVLYVLRLFCTKSLLCSDILPVLMHIGVYYM